MDKLNKLKKIIQEVVPETSPRKVSYLRNINLEDVLLVLHKKIHKKADELNSTVPILEMAEKTVVKIVSYWQLGKPLYLQKPEVWDFLLDVLK